MTTATKQVEKVESPKKDSIVAKVPSKTQKSELIAVIRIRGKVGVRETTERTMKMLNLHRKNWCIVVRNNPGTMGMIRKVKDYCTFGEIDNKTVAKLLEKRGRIIGNKPLTENYVRKHTKVGFDGFATMINNEKVKIKDIPGAKPYFRLMPPKGGFERKGIRTSYATGGALGYRGENISKLIEKML